MSDAAQAFIAFLRCEATQAEERAKSLRATAAAIEANNLKGWFSMFPALPGERTSFTDVDLAHFFFFGQVVKRNANGKVQEKKTNRVGSTEQRS